MIPNRIKRVNTLLLQEITNILRREIKDPRVSGFATLTEVRVSADLRSARVYVSVLEGEEKRGDAVTGLNSAADFIRGLLMKNISLKRIPALQFIADDSIERGVRVSRLIDEIAKEDSAVEQLSEAADFATINEEFSKHRSFALFCHINPDGDAVGACLAVSRALRARGKTVDIFSHDGVPEFFKFMLDPDETMYDKHDAPKMEPNYDAVVLLDCATKKRAGESMFHIIDTARVTINIDHHVTNHTFARYNFIDPEASSTCEILYNFFTDSRWDITPDVAEGLYLGIMYDTGRFIHSNTTPEVFRVCSDLVSMGADPARIANGVYNHRTLASLRMLGHALSHSKFAAGSRVVWASIPRTVFNELGASDPDTEGIVEQLGKYTGCEVHILFTEGPDGKSRASTRSTGRVKVNEICAQYGGGGHDFAAGLRIQMPLEELEKIFIDEVLKKLPED